MEMPEPTVTSFLLVQGLTAVFGGAFADAISRRPVCFIDLVLYLIVNVALSYSPDSTVLVLFRGVQSGGSYPTSILAMDVFAENSPYAGSGVIQNISPPSERSTFTSNTSRTHASMLEGGDTNKRAPVRNFSLAVGPVLGGALAQQLGFRSIFIFLLIGTAVILVAVTLYSLETLRTIAGNGFPRLGGVYQPWLRRFKKPESTRDPGPRAANRITSCWQFLELYCITCSPSSKF
ncbi:major facilitator superfamily transporter [Apiospora marii]|uniref:Major facilitator superfamily transporter n=1 Tax=Apiospora marii TaxID=335849 RepID=A0ABR1R8L5_9PEZI